MVGVNSERGQKVPDTSGTVDKLSERQFAWDELICSVVSRCRMTEVVQNVTWQTMMGR